MLAEAHAASVVELSEISRSLGQYAEQLDLDPEQLAALEERVSLFETLKRKYGGSIAEVIAFGERAAERMRKIEGRDEELERLSKEIERRTPEVERTGQRPAQTAQPKRRRSSPKTSAPTCATSVSDNPNSKRNSPRSTKPSATGFDAIELLFSPNPGEPLKPLRSIASSGEISRLMLAIKSSLAAQDAIPLLVFDEIDANVGGEIANAVGAKMRTLAGDHQVLCITHLPQVAAAALDAFRRHERSNGRTHSFAAERSGGQSAERRNRADARREDRVRAAACGDFVEASVEALAAASASVYNNRCAELHLARAGFARGDPGRQHGPDGSGFRRRLQRRPGRGDPRPRPHRNHGALAWRDAPGGTRRSRADSWPARFSRSCGAFFPTCRAIIPRTERWS